jgi:hypothetical protein
MKSSTPTFQHFQSSPRKRLVGSLAVLALALAACGDGSAPAADPPPPPPPTNAAPVPVFALEGSAALLAVQALDASGSSDAEGDALTYSWDFGDGSKGGGVKIAKAYAAPGNYSVKLTVTDAKGASATLTRQITINPGPAPVALVDTLVQVKGLDGTAIGGVTVAATTGGASATTDANGRATLKTGTGIPVVLKFSRAGFADLLRDASLPTVADSGYLEVTMLPREAALTLADAAAGGSLAGKHGAKITLPPNALVDASGNPVTGTVQVAMTPINPMADARAFPGRFEGVRPDGQAGFLFSYGTVEYVLTAGGNPVQLAAGKKATIEIPIYATTHTNGQQMKLGDTSPLWSLDEKTGQWIEEGSGTVVEGTGPSSFALRAEVQHFSAWNHDQFFQPNGNGARPKPKCLVDTNADGILEDLTGTGHCWHAGTGPEQPDLIFAREQPQSLGSNGTVKLLASPAPETIRVPAWAVWASTPAAGGQVLSIPSGVEVTFRSFAKNGTLFGSTKTTMTQGQEADLPIVLYPVRNFEGIQQLTLPADESGVMSHNGEVDEFRFAVETGGVYDITVSRLQGSLLSANVDAFQASGSAAGSTTLAPTPQTLRLAATESGQARVRVTAVAGAAGGYRIQVRRQVVAGNCLNPTVLALNTTVDGTSLPRNGAIVCFALNLSAGQAIAIDHGTHAGAQGSFTLRAPSGTTMVIDSYGATFGDRAEIRFAAAQAGSYRLEIDNTRTGNGTLNGLVMRELAATTVPSGAEVQVPALANLADRAWFVLQPPSTGAAVAAVLEVSNAAYALRVQGQGNEALVGNAALPLDSDGRVDRRLAEALPLVAVRRNAANGTNPVVKLRNLVPQTLAANTDVDLTGPADGRVLLLAYDANAGDAVSFEAIHSAGVNSGPSAELFSPTGAPLSGKFHTLTEGGTYGLRLRPGFSAPSAATRLRMNLLPPPTEIASTELQTLEGNLALGEVKRYAVNLTQGELLSLTLSDAGAAPFTISAGGLRGGDVWRGNVSLSDISATNQTVHSGPLYVQTSGRAEIHVFPATQRPARATGPFRMLLSRPNRAPAALGPLFSGNLPANTLRSFGFNAAAGAHVLCLRATGPAGTRSAEANPIVWGPSAPFANYDSGDLVVPDQDINRTLDSVYLRGNLRTGQQTITLFQRTAGPIDYIARLTGPEAAPNALTLGAADVTGNALPCQRGLHRFDATLGTTYTVRVTATFNGTVRVLWVDSLGVIRRSAVRTPGVQSLVAGVETVLSGTFRTGNETGAAVFAIDVEPDATSAGGSYTVRVSSP